MEHKIAISQLKQKRAEIKSGITELEIKLRDMRTDLSTVNSALRIFGEETGEAKKYRDRVFLFQAGEISRLIFEALRDAPNGLDTNELSDLAMRSKGFRDDDVMTVKRVKHTVANSLARSAREGKIEKGVLRNGVRVWRRVGG